MGRISKQRPAVKLIIGFIFKQEDIFEKSRFLLEKRFGKIDFQSRTLDFTHTDYYRAEFGGGLKRKFASFQKLIPPQKLPQIKILTNKIEERFLNKRRRPINIDPGYLDLSKLVFASSKDYFHRLYLNKGIFAEVMLFYHNKTFKATQYTYPDYRSREYIAIFNQIRQIYSGQVRAKKCTLRI